MKFYWKVSCAPQNHLSFYIGNYLWKKECCRITGNTGWEEVTYNVGRGFHVFIWEYEKGSNNNNYNNVLTSLSYTSSDGKTHIKYDDCGWLDYVRWIPAKNNPPNQPAKPSGKIVGKTGVTYHYSTSTTDPDGDKIKYEFDWGDGSYTWTDWVPSGEKAYASHSWNNAGTYYIKVKAIDENGAESKWSQSLKIDITLNSPPIVDFTYTPQNPVIGEKIKFKDKSYDIDGKITSWQWNFGDGATSNEQNPTHVYKKVGTYKVTLTVRDDCGAAAYISKNIEIVKPIETIKIAILRDLQKENGIPYAARQIKSILEEKGSWSTPDKIYKFSCDILDYTEVISKLNNGGYRAFIIPGIGAGYTAGFLKNFSPFRHAVREFVRNGGGYLGICGGAVMASSGVDESPHRSSNLTWLERIMNRATLGLINSRVIQRMAHPVFASLLYKDPGVVGQSAYMWYNETTDVYGKNGEKIPLGVTVKLKVLDKNNPLFKNVNTTLGEVSHSFDGTILKIRWWGGPAFESSYIADYTQEVCKMSNTRLHVWKFVGLNISKINIPEVLIKNYTHPTDNDLIYAAGWFENNLDLLNKLGDYVMLKNEYIKTNLQGRGGIAYAKFGKGKVLAFGPHPEDSIWDGGYIKESKDVNFREDRTFNNLEKGLYHWEGYNISNASITADYWILIRGAALVAGVPENELPFSKIQKNHNVTTDKPHNPHPANGATGVSTHITLSWECNGNYVYDVYFGTSKNPQKIATVETNSFNPGTLKSSTTYYWYVVARDGNVEIKGPLWHFTTASSTPHPIPMPPKPPHPIPLNNAY